MGVDHLISRNSPISKDYEASNRIFSVDSTMSLGSFIFPDIRALYNLKLFKNKALVYNEIKLTGFEVYIVEQWIAERKSSSLITCFTGNSQDTISAVELILPTEPSKWLQELREYHNELLEFAQPKCIKEGTLFITDLFNVTSTLNLLHIECGDIRKIWDNFKINFDLKRLHCGGRSALLLNAPTAAAEDKFSQLYKIPMGSNSRQHGQTLQTSFQNVQISDICENRSGGTPCNNPVVELITLIQISLGYFNLYPVGIAKEGLLYDGTKASIDKWWDEYGKLYLGLEKPKKEATIGPTTVAALLSLIMSCFLKLVVADCTSSKDPFGEDEFYSAIYTFQKKHGLTKSNPTVFLDHQTLEKLFEVSAKTSNSDIFKIKKVVKSTVQDITGKGTKLLSNEILTTDLDTFIQNVNAASLSDLWNGKAQAPKSGKKRHGRISFCSLKFSNGVPQEVLEEQHLRWQRIQQEKDMEYNSDDNSDDDDGISFKGDNRLSHIQRFSTLASSMSLSSMVCNYDKKKYLQSYGINKIYQKEYYRRNSLSASNDNSKLVSVVSAESDIVEMCRLHRCVSLSKVQDAIETWSLPFDPSLVKMAKDLLIVKEHLGVRKGVSTTQGSFFTIMDHDTSLQYDEFQFTELKKQLQIMYDDCISNATRFKGVHQDIEKRKMLIVSEMRELESLSSKLKYNIRILDRRMKDVEHSVNQFDSKLKAVEKSFMNQGFCSQIPIHHLTDNIQFEEHVKTIIHSQSENYECLSIRLFNRFYGGEFMFDFKELILRFFNRIFHKPTVRSNKKAL